MGRSRGGLTTKIHALVDADGLPITLKLTEGQANDGRSANDMLASLGAGDILLADAAYDSHERRAVIEARGALPNIKPMTRRKTTQVFSKYLYRSRNLVELLQQAQALPRYRDALRQTRRQLPRINPARIHHNLDTLEICL